MNRLASPSQLRASFVRWALFLVPAVLLLGYLSGWAGGNAASDPWFVALDKPAIAVTIVLFWQVRRTAALLLLPYLAWILFATVLNYQFLRLNPEADGVESSYAVQRIEL